MQYKNMLHKNFILGIESSCDETAIAILACEQDQCPQILSHSLFSQIKEHAPYGGVVPEIAARVHLDRVDSLMQEALEKSGISLKEINVIAATAGPGLIGGVIVGLMYAKGICAASGKPLIGVNHLEGHILSPRIEHNLDFPYLLLLASGGHCQIILVKDFAQYQVIGQTIDDAAGEAFDKVAKMLGLGMPGGVNVEKRALLGNAKRFQFPRPLIKEDGMNFSFSGLKTAVFREYEKHDIKTDELINDICASFQAAVVDCFTHQIQKAMYVYNDQFIDKEKNFVIAGGVAANKTIRAKLEDLSTQNSFKFTAPSMQYCTDNGVMIAWAGYEHFKRGRVDNLDITPRARWVISE